MPKNESLLSWTRLKTRLLIKIIPFPRNRPQSKKNPVSATGTYEARKLNLKDHHFEIGKILLLIEFDLKD
jgi:hypothetical protein